MEISFDTDNITMEGIFFFLLILLGSLVLMVILGAAFKNSQTNENPNKPKKTQRATLLEKRPAIGFGLYTAVFETEEGKRIQLTTALSTLVVGDTGTLVWQEQKLLSFTRDRADDNKQYEISTAPKNESRFLCPSCGGNLTAQDIVNAECPWCRHKFSLH